MLVSPGDARIVNEWSGGLGVTNQIKPTGSAATA
jgi:hypothetical protein